MASDDSSSVCDRFESRLSAQWRFAVAAGALALSACGGGGGSAPAAGVTADTASSASAPAPASAAVAATPPATSAVSNGTTIKVRASASPYAGVGALASVRYNGVELSSIVVSQAAATDYSINTTAPLDGGLLDIVFSNATDAQGVAVRTLKVESVTVAGAVLLPTDSQVTYDRGEGVAAFDGQDVLSGRALLTRAGALRFAVPAQQQSKAANSDASARMQGVYIDADSGDDTAAGTIDRPWRTLARLAGARLQAGDGIYLHCGSVWRESLALSAAQLNDGTAVAGYGSECASRKAVITGADDFSGGWTLNGSVWSRSLPAGTPKITQLFITGEPLRTAQWPDSAAGRQAAVLGTGSASKSQLSLQTADAAALAAKDLVGATIQVTTQPWYIETGTIGSAANGALTLAKTLDWTADVGKHFVLQDKLWMLDSAGEFFHDVAAQKLYLMAPAVGAPADLNTARVEGSVRDVALALSQRKNLSVTDVSLRAARLDGLRLLNAPQATVTRAEIVDNAQVGIRLEQFEPLAAGAAGPVVSDSVLSGNGQYGIKAHDVTGAVIRNNRLLATGNNPNQLSGVFAAIAAGPGAQITDNTVDGSGYVGISFSAVGGSLVARNTISGYCTRLSDCGAIYTWQGRGGLAAAQSASVEGNRVLSARGDLAAAVSANREVVVGIYLDDFTSGVTVRNNVLAGTPIGVFLHNASSNTVEGNQIWMPSLVALWASMDQTDADWMRGNKFRSNQIVPLVQAQAGTGTAPALPSFSTSQAVWFWHGLDGESALGAGRNEFAGNSVVQLQGPIAAHANLRGPAGERFVDALTWKSLNPAEPLPTQPMRYDTLTLALGAEMTVGGTFDAGLGTWQSYRDPAGSGFAVQAAGTAAGCSGPCVSFTAGSRGDLLASPAFSLRPAGLYVYRWTVVNVGSTPATVAVPYISRDGSPFDQMSDARGYVGVGTRQVAAGATLAHDAFFVAKSADPARVNVQMETLRTAVAVDTVSVREVTGLVTVQAADWSALAFASAAAPRTIGCAELGWAAGCSAVGIDGQAVALPLTLAASTQRLLLRADSTLRH